MSDCKFNTGCSSRQDRGGAESIRSRSGRSEVDRHDLWCKMRSCFVIDDLVVDDHLVIFAANRIASAGGPFWWTAVVEWRNFRRNQYLPLRSHVVVGLRSTLMSFGLSSSLASGRNPESSYRDSSTSDHDHRTPSPPVHQDEYTPTRQSVRSITWTTPSQRSNTASISSSTRIALDKLYKKIYGDDSLRCLLMKTTGGLNIAHAVRRASKSDEVSHFLPHEMALWPCL
jgi:hypothetical protein